MRHPKLMPGNWDCRYWCTECAVYYLPLAKGLELCDNVSPPCEVVFAVEFGESIASTICIGQGFSRGRNSGSSSGHIWVVDIMFSSNCVEPGLITSPLLFAAGPIVTQVVLREFTRRGAADLLLSLNYFFHETGYSRRSPACDQRTQ
jgi:hypothetical protein